MRQNLTKKIVFTSNALYGCPQWWINYIKAMSPLFEEALMKRLYKEWKVNGRKNEDDFLELIFPSEEVYIQFLLTYS